MIDFIVKIIDYITMDPRDYYLKHIKTPSNVVDFMEFCKTNLVVTELENQFNN